MTQEMKILEYIEKHGSITQLEATMELGITRLAARIADLRDAGHDIISEYEVGLNRFGEKTRYKRYRLAVRT